MLDGADGYIAHPRTYLGPMWVDPDGKEVAPHIVETLGPEAAYFFRKVPKVVDTGPVWSASLNPFKRALRAGWAIVHPICLRRIVLGNGVNPEGPGAGKEAEDKLEEMTPKEREAAEWKAKNLAVDGLLAPSQRCSP